MTEERRGSPRGIVDCEARIVTSASSDAGRLRTLSRLGALVRLEHALPVGIAVSLFIIVPAEDQLELRGQIVRGEGYQGAADVAVMFAPLTSSAIAKIDSLIASSDV